MEKLGGKAAGDEIDDGYIQVIVAMKDIFPGDDPVTLLAMRDPPLNPILNTVGRTAG